MNEYDRIIGKLEEFKESSVVRFDRLEDKVDKLSKFHWKIAGGVTVIFCVFELLLNFR